MQLHPVTIIIGLLIFGYFFGIIGMVFATPCLALLKVLWRFIRNKYDLFTEKNVSKKEIVWYNSFVSRGIKMFNKEICRELMDGENQ